MQELWDREQLYKEIWAEPAVRVALRHGVSDVALGKICRKMNVPVPGRGYWAKKANGHQMKQIPLPAMKNPPRLEKPSPRPDTPPKPRDEELEAINQRRRAGEFDPLPLKSKPHPMIAETRRALATASEDMNYHVLHARGNNVLNAKVSKASLGRTLDLLARVIQVLERVGAEMKVKVPRDYGKSVTMAVIAGAEVSFRIRERLRMTKSQSKSASEYPAYNYAPNGKLLLEIDNYAPGEKKAWEDRESSRLAAQIPEIVAGILRVAIVQRRQDEERKRQEIAARQRETQLYELSKEVAREEDRVEALLRDAANWIRADQLRRYIAALEITLATDGTPPDAASDQGRFLTWAKQQADRLDPLRPSPSSILDHQSEVAHLLRYRR